MRILALVAALPLLALWPADSDAADWAVYTSEHFTVYSDDLETKVRGLIMDFEAFRRVALTITGITDQPENRRMIVLVYGDSRHFGKLAPNSVAGFYSDTDAGPRMVVGPGVGAGLMTIRVILFHEYSHYLLREHSSLVYPKWYDEGFAELLSATTMEDGEIVLGAVASHRIEDLRRLRKMSISELLDPNYASGLPVYWARFYAHAWLFTHYLQIGSLDQKDELRQQTRNYIERVHGGDDPIAAFTASYGMTPDDMDADLTRYRRNRHIPSIALKLEEYDGKLEKRALDPNEEAFLLADMAWRRGNEPAALNYLEGVSSDLSNAARPLSLSAVLLNHEEKVDEARRDAAWAASLAPDDSLVLANLAHFEYDCYTSSYENGSPDLPTLRLAIEYGQQAAAADAGNLEAYRYQWLGYQAADEVANAARAMMAAYQIAPSSTDLNLEIGEFLFERGHRALAKPFLERVLAWSHSEEQHEKVSAMLERIEAGTSE